MNRILNIFCKPIVISFVLTSVIIMFIPKIKKYEVEFSESKIKREGDYNHFEDIDNDGNCEKIRYYKSFDGERQAIIIEQNDLIVGQWNFPGCGLSGVRRFFSGDFNRDNLKEIYVFTYINDSVFLNYFSPLDTDQEIQRKFIIKGKNLNGKIEGRSVGFYDLNDDGFLEATFTLNVGFPKHPRQLYAFDIANNNILRTPHSGYYLKNVNFFKNQDNYLACIDGASYCNCSDTAKYSDMYSWLMVFNHQLEFAFQPINLGKGGATLFAKPFNIDDKFRILVAHLLGMSKDSSSLRLYDLDGNLIKKKYLDNNKVSRAKIISAQSDKVQYLINNSGAVFNIDKNLNLIYKGNIGCIEITRELKYDIENDGQDELIFHKQDNQGLIITRNGLEHPVEIDFCNVARNFHFTTYPPNIGAAQIILTYNEKEYVYDYYISILYKYQYLIYIGIWLVLSLLIWQAFILIKYFKLKRIEAENLILQLQMKSFKNQIDPHFTLNMLNSIGSLFEQNESKKASYLFERYAKFLQTTIFSSDKILLSIAEELKYVQNYLDLEQSRLTNRFEYRISKEDNVDIKVEIPKMLIYIFVENAIKHGIRPLQRSGIVEICLKQSSDCLTICIMDNGIGRQQAEILNTNGTGKGLQILDQIIKAYEKLKRHKINYNIIDLLDGDKGIGTRIDIIISPN